VSGIEEINDIPGIERKLKDRIEREGPLTYEAFLDTVLYDEEEGYYREGKQSHRDFCTSPEIHPLFGQTLAAYIENLRISCGADRLTIVELGGGSGLLADQITSFCNGSTDYVIIERGIKATSEPIVWVNDLRKVAPIDGVTVFIANEFFDALPCHRVVMAEDELREVYVDFSDGFAEFLGPLTSKTASFLRVHPLTLNLHQTSEVNVRSAEILSEVDRIVDEGLLLLFDYGYHIEDLVRGRFFGGSIIGCKDFKVRENLFYELGKADITHHVNFDHLGDTLKHLAWKKTGEIEQYRFLINAGILERLAALRPEERIMAKALINPQGIGSTFSVLGFTKNLSCEVPGFASKDLFFKAEKV
jgi:SAM-dependent MidA family methyltransferase